MEGGSSTQERAKKAGDKYERVFYADATTSTRTPGVGSSGMN